MLANELRIGNLFKNAIGKILPIKDYEFRHLTSKHIDYKAIPITEEMLLKLGFNKEYKNGWIGIDVKHESGMTTDFVLAEPNKMGEWQTYYAFVYDGYRFVKIEYIHELQNLFFAITKKELMCSDVIDSPT